MKKLIVLCSLLAGACATDEPCVDDGDCIGRLGQESSVISSSLVSDFTLASSDVYYSLLAAPGCEAEEDFPRIMTATKSGGSPSDVYLFESCDPVPMEVVADSTYIYFIDQQAGSVNKVPISPGSLTTVDTGNTFSAAKSQKRLALDASASELFWHDATGGWIMKYDTSGGSVSQFYDLPAGHKMAFLVFDANNLYYAHGASIYQVTRSSPTATTLYTSSSNSSIDALAISGSDLYWTESGTQFEVRKRSGGSTTLMYGSGGARLGHSILHHASTSKTFEIDSDTTPSDFDMFKVVFSNPNWVRSEVVAATDLTDGRALAADSTHLFFLTSSGIQRELLSGL